MKRTLLFFACVLASITMSAQEGMTVEEVQNSDSIYSYHSFLKEGKTWNYQEYYHNIWTELEWTKDVSYVIDGTTEKDGKTYYNLYRISEDGKKFYCALREEDRRVWQYSSDESKHMIYDFGMSVGDCYMPSPFEQYYFQLKSIKPKWFHNDQLLNVCFYDMVDETIGPAINSVPVPIVEGVGCRKGWNIFNYLAPRATNGIIHEEEFLSCYEDGACIFTADDFKHLSADDDVDYRPFVEDGKVWKVGAITSGNPAQWVEYFYFSGDTIINEKTCKQMMRQRFVHPDFAVSNSFSQDDSLSYVGAWYEEDKKVYEYDTESTQFKLMYDFSADVNNNVRIGNLLFVLGPRYTGGISGFKGAHREVWECDYEESVYYRYAPWLEGVGGIYGPPTLNFFNVELGDPLWALMSCTVSDEVIYLDDDYEDGATPAEARKRFDFTHTIKTQPKAPGWKSGARATSPAEAGQSLYGEYNDQQLGINLAPLNDAYVVRITDETDKVVYEKAINAGSIVGLNIDISAYAAGRYTVTVENGSEFFTGEFDTLTSGIEENELSLAPGHGKGAIYNLQGQRLSTLQRGLNIVNGRKVYAGRIAQKLQ